jgi:RNA recognition motif-containing protein
MQLRVSSTRTDERAPLLSLGLPLQLPWSTSNEDLVELFETTGEVVAAEVLLEPNGRSRGVGVCEFVAVEQATSAIAKFTGYVCASLRCSPHSLCRGPDD